MVRSIADLLFAMVGGDRPRRMQSCVQRSRTSLICATVTPASRFLEVAQTPQSRIGLGLTPVEIFYLPEAESLPWGTRNSQTPSRRWRFEPLIAGQLPVRWLRVQVE